MKQLIINPRLKVNMIPGLRIETEAIFRNNRSFHKALTENAGILSKEVERFDDKTERRHDTLVLRSTTRVSRAAKGDQELRDLGAICP